MRLLALLLVACAAPQRPPPRLADEVQVQHVQIGWMQIATGQLNKPPVNDLTRAFFDKHLKGMDVKVELVPEADVTLPDAAPKAK